MRHQYSGVFRDGAGNIVASGTVAVYLAGVATAASIYTTSTGTTAVNSTTSGSDGTFTFYVDRFDYDRNQQFKIVLSKTGFSSKTYDYVDINNLITGTYTISADKTVTTDLGYIPKGVVYSIASGKTLMLNGPFSAGAYQIFSGTGTVSIGSGAPIRYVEWFGAKDDSGTTDNTTAIQAALNVGGLFMLNAPNGGYYKITDALTASVAGTKIISKTKAEIRQATAAKGGIAITASGIEVDGIKLTATQYADRKAAEIGIHAYGADSSHYITDIKINNCEIATWGEDAIRLAFVSDFEVNSNKINNIFYSAITTLSSIRGTIELNNINTVSGTPYAYGIALTRSNNDSLVTKPRSGYINVKGNIIRNVTNWEGIDTHGGEYIDIDGNILYGNKVGILVGDASNTAGTGTFAPLNVNVRGNIINSGVTDGTAARGIIFTGADGVQSATGSISGNTIDGHGDESVNTAYGCAIWADTTDGLIISGNTILRPAPVGIYMESANVGSVITGNSILDAWSNTVTTPTGIFCNSTKSSISIHGNFFSDGSKTATYTFANGRAISIANVPDNDVSIGRNDIFGVDTYVYDTGFHSARLDISGSDATSGTGEDTLSTLTIPATTMGDRGGIRITAAGTKTDTNNEAKTIKLYFGSAAWTVISADQTADDWRIEAIIFNTDTNAQVVSWKAYNGATPTQGFETSTEDSTADIVVKCTGEVGATGADSITQRILFIERL